MKKTRIFFIALLLVVLSAAVYLGYAAKPEAPQLPGVYTDASLVSSERQRHYKSYTPSTLTAGSPLLMVLHGSMQNINDIRVASGYEFERLAEQHGFLLIYPQGYKNNWNDCRKTASYPAKAENIDDLSFLQALIEKAKTEYHIDTRQVFMAGWSNGGHMGFKAALEKPDMFSAIAAISANLPTAEHSDCHAEGKPMSVLIMNGTEDPINPYQGGRVTLFGFGDRGQVLSSIQTAEYFANLAGDTTAPLTQQVLTQSPQHRQGSVVVKNWRASGNAEISLVTLQGGGHLIPQGFYRAPHLLGNNTPEFNGPEFIWQFFERQH